MDEMAVRLPIDLRHLDDLVAEVEGLCATPLLRRPLQSPARSGSSMPRRFAIAAGQLGPQLPDLRGVAASVSRSSPPYRQNARVGDFRSGPVTDE
jgi:hypothetical protein